jgi:hypothetical protein
MDTSERKISLEDVRAAVAETEAHGEAILATEAPGLAAVDGLTLAADRAQALAVRWARAEDRAPSGLVKVRRLSLRASRLRALALRLRPRAMMLARLGRIGTVEA